jgi:PAS domain S-box-containing protein
MPTKVMLEKENATLRRRITRLEKQIARQQNMTPKHDYAVWNNLLDAVYQRNLRTDKYEYLSPVIKQLVGWSAQEMTHLDTLTMLNRMHPDDLPLVEKEIQRTNALCQTTGKATGVLEYRFRTIQGDYRWLGDYFTVIADEEGKPLYRSGAVRDITEHKQMEKILRQWAHAFENCAHGIALGDPTNNTILACNPPFARLHKCTVAELVGTPILDVYSLQDHALVRRSILQADQTGHCSFEAEMVRKDGSTYPVQMDIVSVRDQSGTLLYRVATEQDITERRRTDEELRKAREMNFLAHEAVDIGIWQYDFETTMIHLDERVCKHIDFPMNDATLNRILARVHPDDLEMLKQKFSISRTLPNELREIDFRVIHQDASVHWLSTAAHVWFEGKGVNRRATKIFGTTLDITERKRTEQALRESEEKYRSLFEHMQEAFFLCQIIEDERGQPSDVRFLDVNYAWASLINHPREEIIGHTYRELFPPNQSLAVWLDHFAQVARSGKPDRFEYYGEATGLYLEAFAFSPNPGQCAVVLNNLTARRRAEEEIIRAKAKLDAALASMTDAVFISDAEGHVVDFNLAFATFHKFKNKADCAKTLAEYPEFLEMFLGNGQPAPLNEWAIPRALRGEIGTNVEYSLRRKDTNETWVASYSFAPIRNREGAIVGSVVVGRDITDIKRAQEELRERKEELERLLDLMPAAIFIAQDAECKHIRGNHFANEMLNVPPGENVSVYNRAPTTHTSLFRQGKQLVDELPLDMAVKTGRAQNDIELVVERPDKETLMLTGGSIPLFDAQGKPRGAVAVFHDITTYKRAQQELSYANAYNRSLIEASLDALVTIGPDGKITDVNAETERVTGYSRTELVGTDFSNYFTEPERASAGYQLVFRQGAVRDYPLEIRHRSGHTISVLYHATVYRNTAGQVMGVFAAARDITERKRMQALTEARYRIVNFAQSHTLDQVLQNVLDETELLTNSKIGFFHFMQADQTTLSLQAWSTRTVQEFCRATGKGSHYPVDQAGVWVDCVRERRPVIHNDYATLTHRKGMPEGHAQVIRQAVVPVFRGDMIVAILGVGNKENNYDDQDIALISQIADLSWDIAERKRTEEQLHENEKRFRTLAIATSESIYRTSPDWSEMYHLVENDFVADALEPNQTWLSKYVHPKNQERVTSAIQQAIRNKSVFELEYQVLRVDGTWGWTFSRAIPILNANGEIVEWFGAASDITERKRAETALRESEEKYRQLSEALEIRVAERTTQIQDLYDNAPIGYHSLDPNGTILMVNKTELNWLGYTRQEMLGHHITNFFTPASQTIIRTQYPLFKQRGWLKDLELEFVRKDGTILPTLVNATAIYDEQGNFTTSRSTVFDNTERKRAEDAVIASRDALRVANIELARASKLKDEFLANMSHELRTPLNAILGLAESLQEPYLGVINDKQLQAIKVIEASGQRLLRVVNNLLDLSKLQSGELILTTLPIDPREICQASLRFVSTQAQTKHIQMSFQIDTAIEQMWADEKRSRQMLIELLKNAVEFTPDGGQVGLEVTGDAINNQIKFTVWDTGPGIAQENLPLLFQSFFQVDGTLTRQHEGAGLGLPLVAQLAKMHGGSIVVSSQPGQGSRFTIQLPWTETMRHASTASTNATTRTDSILPPVAHSNLDTPLVLITEDNESNITTLTLFLENQGFRLAVARNGDEALAMAHTLFPALILMDLQMPVLNGLDTTRQLRRDPDPRLANVPIIALTALVMPGDREQAIAAGANEYLSKPVNLKQLTETIKRLIQ